MSQNDPTSTKPSDSSAVTSASEGASDATTNPASPSPVSTENQTASAAPAGEERGSAPSASAEPAAAANADPSAAAEGDDGEEGDETGDAAEGGAAGAEGTPGAEGAPGKRKRRRRRKKKPGEAGAAAGAEGGAGGAAGSGEHARPEGWVEGDLHPMGPPRPPRQHPEKQHAKKERPERERPAFNVGDVVFGKVLEVTEDALFADLSGKAKAIFDLRELLITEEEAEEYNRAHKADRKAAQADPEEAAHAAAERAEAAAAAGAPEGTEGEAVAVEGAPATKDEHDASPPATEVSPGQPAAEPAAASETSTSDGATAEAAVPAAAESASGLEGADEPKAPQLPRVILEPGAPFVGLVHNDGGRGGLVVLTHHPKRVSKAKPMVAEASRSGALVFGLVTGTIKGGVEVDVDGLRAFAPASHVDLRPGSDLSHLVGKRLAFAVTQYAKRGRDVVLSRRALLESEYKEKREEALKNIKFGEVVMGVVRTVVPFGAFIDIGGVEGLVPLSEMSHNRADGPKDVFKVNETVKVKILRVDEKGKLWLSRKSAVDDPWGEVAQKYAQGTRHKGKVVRLQPFGAFVELENGIDGLIHSADLSIKRIEHPEEVVKIGDEIDVVVSQVDSRQHRIALHPAPSGEAANEEPQKIVLGKMVKVVVVVVEAGGLVVRVKGATGRNARGFISAMATGTPRGTELRKLFPVGKELEVKIIEMDPRRGEVKLSIKALNEETERNAYQTYRAQVKREAKFGTLADLLAKRNITPSK
jgi:small subunit ribosomal protein S1